jgi:hypothetical protein
MISAAKLKYLTNINADEMTGLLLDAGYKGRDEWTAACNLLI